MTKFLQNSMENKNINVEILCIGTELLLGNIVNSNARWLAEQLSSLGINHYRQTVIGDNFTRLKQVIKEASNRCQVVITTGGLGPTPDDLTTEAIASAFNTPLIKREDIWEEIEKKLIISGKSPSKNNETQAYFPKKSVTIDNPTGTAPGMIWSPLKDFTILTFPGVPSEMKKMWKASGETWFKNNIQNEAIYLSRVLKIVGISESSLAEDIDDIIFNQNPTVAPYASLGEVKLRITAKASNYIEAENLIKPIESELCKRVASKCYGTDNDTLSSVLINLLRERKETLSVAESCTGGLLGAELTSISGASDVFLGGVIAYNNSIKENFLGVPKKLIENHGAVSQQVVESMAKASLKNFGSTWSIAISGLAGPNGATEDKPIGLVHIAIAGPFGIQTKQQLFNASKGRHNIQKLSVIYSLDRLRLLLLAKS